MTIRRITPPPAPGRQACKVSRMPPGPYRGIAYRQSRHPDALWLVAFVATAKDLLPWAGIPRRSESIQAAFQRMEDPVRVDRARRFFEFAENQSPTAVVLGIHPVGE